MIQPVDMTQHLPIDLSSGSSNTSTVWQMLVAARNGELSRIKQLITQDPQLAFCKYNYTPPVHFAVREGHIPLVEFLLHTGAHDPTYRTYPFGDDLTTIAAERGHHAIKAMLQAYEHAGSFAFRTDWNGVIHFERTPEALAFESAVDKGDLVQAEILLKTHPALIADGTYFWGEGILAMPAHDGNEAMVKLLMQYGAKVPELSKWGQYYYFEKYSMAAFLLENGMAPLHQTWHHVTLLHDMASKGLTEKAALLLKHGAPIDTIEEEYQSTPLGLAVRWGHTAMVDLLLEHRANTTKAGAPWATPLAWAASKGHPHLTDRLLKAGAGS